MYYPSQVLTDKVNIDTATANKAVPQFYPQTRGSEQRLFFPCNNQLLGHLIYKHCLSLLTPSSGLLVQYHIISLILPQSEPHINSLLQNQTIICRL